ncbi:MAG: hypothetical protein OIF36_03890 [Alphaproteobacteria bacterium]|nr:hypothetical protein [Alphaproteobacteria bacterium]
MNKWIKLSLSSFVVLFLLGIGLRCCFCWEWTTLWSAISSIGTLLAVVVALYVLDINTRRSERNKREELLNTLVGIKIEISALYKNFEEQFLPEVEKIRRGEQDAFRLSMAKPHNNYFIFYDSNNKSLVNLQNKDNFLQNIFLLYNSAKALLDAYVAYGNNSEMLVVKQLNPNMSEEELNRTFYNMAITNTQIMIASYDRVTLYYEAVHKEIDIEIDNLRKELGYKI